MLDFENLDNLYTLAFAMRKKKHWLSLPWDFLLGIKTIEYGTWYGLPIINYDDRAIGFAVYDQEYGLPVARYMLDEQRMETAHENEYEYDSFLYNQHAYYFTFENKSDLKHWQEAKWLQAYCEKHELKCRGKRCYPSFHHLKPSMYASDLTDMKDVAFCESFVGALACLDKLVATGEIVPQQWQCSQKIREALTLPALVQQEDGSWTLGEENIPELGTLNWPRLSLNDFDTARMKRFPKNGSTWQMEKFVHDMDDITFACQGKVGELIDSGAGVYVDALVVYDETLGHVMFMDNFFMRIEGQAGIMSFLMDAMEKDGRPMKIVVGSEESYEFVKEFCRKLDIQLVMDEVPQLVTIRENVLAGRNPMKDFDDEEWVPADPRDEWDAFHGTMPKGMGNIFAGGDRKKGSKNGISQEAEEDVIHLTQLVASYMKARDGSRARAKKAEEALNSYLDSKYPELMHKVDNHMLEILLNLAMAFPMDSMFFFDVMGEYQRRLTLGEAGFLTINMPMDMDKHKR